MTSSCRTAIADYVRAHARPVNKFSHQPRVYHLAVTIGDGLAYDDDVLYAAAWLHDIGVFIGHRPEDPAALERWNMMAYAIEHVPALLRSFGFAEEKIPAVLEAIRTHQPHARPTSIEGTLLRDADILEQLGAVAVLRTVTKVGSDTRFHTFSDAMASLRRALDELPGLLTVPKARRLADARADALRAFLDAVAREADGQPL